VIAAAATAGLVCGLTATTAVAATAKKAMLPTVLPTTVTWHKLTLLNGWHTGRGPFVLVSDPSYAVSGGIVYLDGGLYQAAGTNTEFAILPAGARPAHKEYLTVYSGFSETPGTVEIRPNGVMTASSPSGSTRQDTSLAALSYPAAGATWTNLSLVNGWHSGATAFGTGNPAVTVRSGIVYLAGSLFTHGTVTLAAHLGTNARPRSVVYISVYEHGGLAGAVKITPSGSIYVHGLNAATQTALDGISYPTNAANLSWHLLPLSTGWSSSQSAWQTGDPEYAIRGPIVYLAGSMNFDTASTGNATFTSVPTAAQAINELDRQVYTFGVTTGELILEPAPAVVLSTPMSNGQQFTSLAGIAYPRNS